MTAATASTMLPNLRMVCQCHVRLACICWARLPAFQKFSHAYLRCTLLFLGTSPDMRLWRMTLACFSHPDFRLIEIENILGLKIPSNDRKPQKRSWLIKFVPYPRGLSLIISLRRTTHLSNGFAAQMHLRRLYTLPPCVLKCLRVELSQHGFGAWIAGIEKVPSLISSYLCSFSLQY